LLPESKIEIGWSLVCTPFSSTGSTFDVVLNGERSRWI